MQHKFTYIFNTLIQILIEKNAKLIINVIIGATNLRPTRCNKAYKLNSKVSVIGPNDCQWGLMGTLILSISHLQETINNQISTQKERSISEHSFWTMHLTAVIIVLNKSNYIKQSHLCLQY